MMQLKLKRKLNWKWVKEKSDRSYNLVTNLKTLKGEANLKEGKKLLFHSKIGLSNRRSHPIPFRAQLSRRQLVVAPTSQLSLNFSNDSGTFHLQAQGEHCLSFFTFCSKSLHAK